MYGNPADSEALRDEESMRRRDLRNARMKLIEGHPPSTAKGREAWRQYRELTAQGQTSRQAQVEEQ